MNYPREPIHDYGCDEWCNHCTVCGTGVLYGSRCHDHPLIFAVADDDPDETAGQYMHRTGQIPPWFSAATQGEKP